MQIDDALFEACRSGEQAAWTRLFHQVSDRTYRWAVLRGLRPPEAEDAAQEVLAIAYRRFDTCACPAALDAWLYQITRRVVANTHRRVWWRRVLPMTPPEPAFVPHEAGREAEMSVRTCLARLPTKQAEVLMLSDIEGYTRIEVAQMTGASPGTVASRLRLARAAFRTHWTAEESAPVMEQI